MIILESIIIKNLSRNCPPQLLHSSQYYALSPYAALFSTPSLHLPLGFPLDHFLSHGVYSILALGFNYFCGDILHFSFWPYIFIPDFIFPSKTRIGLCFSIVNDKSPSFCFIYNC